MTNIYSNAYDSDYDGGVLKAVPQVGDNEVFVVFNVFRFYSVVAARYACSCKYKC